MNSVDNLVQELSVTQAFEKQVDTYAEETALVYENRRWTYAELNQKSNQLAHYLVNEHHIGSDKLVGIMTDRSDWTIVAMLATLKAGGAFVPIDPQYPRERIRYIVSDTGTNILLLQSSYMFDVTDINCQFFALDIQTDTLDTSKESPCSYINPDSLAYIIYTSGTTGKPKGVKIAHASLSNYVNWFLQEGNISASDSSVLLSSYAFDLGYTAIWSSLLSGGQLHMISEDFGKVPEKIIAYLSEYKISYIKATPSLFHLLIQAAEWQEAALALRLIVLGGETIKVDEVEHYLQKYPDTVFMNHYGPTETTIGTLSYTITQDTISQFKRKPVIGKPISGNQVYLMDHRLTLAPIGTLGEICVSGIGLSKGYLNNDELTSEKFVQNPYDKSKQLYKTGDYGRWTKDGAIEFAGRRDEQVKIRGYRIELEEVASVLNKHENVSDAVVVIKEDGAGNGYLTAYVVPSGDVDIDDLNRFLGKYLPDYMVPPYVVPLQTMPLTPNGKLDKQALPDPTSDSLAAKTQYEAPATELEQKLAEVWQRVLNRTSIGINNNFFTVGGDSIKAIQIASWMHKEGYQLEVKDLFQYPTIKELALELKELEGSIDQSPVEGEIPLIPIQHRFFSMELENQHHYNQSVMFWASDGLEESAVRAVFSEIIHHHDMLRASYSTAGDKPPGRLKKEVEPVLVTTVDLRDEKEPKEALISAANELQASIDLENSPLLKVGLYRLPDGDRLLVVVHHLVVDGISWRILFEDIGVLFNQYKQNTAFSLPLKTNSFKEWSQELSIYANSEKFLKEKEYWKKITSSQFTAIPQDFDAKTGPIKESARHSFKLSKGDTEKLLTTVHKAFKTEINDILLAALGQTIKKVWKIERALVELESHGREDIIPHLNISRTVGWFTSKYPIILDMANSAEAGKQVKKIKEMLRNVPQKGIGYGMLKYMADPVHKEGIDFETSPQISFNYLGQFDADVERSTLPIADEYAGHQIDVHERLPYELNLSGMVSSGALAISIQYSPSQFKDETIRHFSQSYYEVLKELITYCSSQEAYSPTPSDFLFKELTIKQVEELSRQYELENILPLSPMQEGMLYHSIVDKSDTAYFSQTSYRLTGHLAPEIVEKSLAILHQRHQILRTVFIYQQLERPVQVILKHRQPDFQFIDITDDGSWESKEKRVEAFKKEDKCRSIDLSKDAMMRVAVIQLSDTAFEFIWSHHHILKDGWSTGIIISEYASIYEALASNQPWNLPPVKDYSHYIEWLERQDQAASRKYWETYLEEYTTIASFPQKKVPAGKGYDSQSLRVYIDEAKTKALTALAASRQITLNALIQVVWGRLLAAYNNTEDVTFGIVVSGRPPQIEGIESMVGLFINTIPVRIQFDKDTTLLSLLESNQKNWSNHEAHQYHSLAEIQSLTPLKQNLFDHILIFDNYPLVQQIQGLNGKRGSQKELTVVNATVSDHAHYPLTVVIGPGEKLYVNFDYNSLVYDQELIQQIADHFINLLDQTIEAPATLVSKLSLMSAQQEEGLLEFLESQSVQAKVPAHVLAMFDQCVQKYPDHLALVFEGQTWTYEQLDSKSNQLANYLVAKHHTIKGRPVGIMTDRSDWTIISMLAILKAGGAFVPIDPQAPKERISFIINDTSLGVLLLQSSYMFDVEHIGCELFVLDIQADTLEEPTSPPAVSVSSDDLAYIMYTSGTTGRPKGVMIEHGSLANYAAWLINTFAISERDSTALLSSHTFDLGYTSVWGALLSGGALHMLSYDFGQAPEQTLRYISQHKITFIKTTPSFFYMLSHIENWEHEDLKLRLILLGGEAIKADDVDRYLRRYPDTVFVNHYGPTETTIGALNYVVTKENITSFKDRPLVGQPITNNRVYIMNAHWQLSPYETEGEICLSGKGLARGYVKQADLNSNKFVLTSYQDGSLLYRTGDYGRMTRDGNIEFIGRKDEQVKIRGYRVELGEIVNALIQYPDLTSAIALPQQDRSGNTFVVAYFVAHQKIDTEEVRSFIRQYLPDYMIPAHFVQVDQFPIKENGKVDRRALPKIKTLENLPQKPVEARNEAESTLVDIWKKVLEREEIGVLDNFFSLGGDSIKAVRLIGSVNKSFQLMTEVKDIFEYQDVASFAAYLADQQNHESGEKLAQAATWVEEYKKEILNDETLRQKLPQDWEDLFPMSDIQIGMMYDSMVNPEAGVYFSQVPSRFSDDSFNIDLFRRAVLLLAEKHPILRTTFELSNFPVAMQIVHQVDADQYSIALEDISSLKEENQHDHIREYLKSDFENSFQEGRAYLWRIKVFKLSQVEHCLLLTHHHAMFDGWSDSSFYTELTNLYYNLKKDAAYRPDLLKASYKDYVIEQFRYKRLNHVQEFWKKYLDGYKRCEYPFHKKDTALTDKTQTTISAFNVEEPVAKRIQEISAEENVPVKNIFLTAFMLLLKLTTGSNDITIGLVSNGRPDKEDGDKILGCFLNSAPFRRQFLEQESVSEVISGINQEVIRHKGFDKLPLPDIAQIIGEESSLHNPIFDIRFDYVDFYINKEKHEETKLLYPSVQGRNNSDHRFSVFVKRLHDNYLVRFFSKANLLTTDEAKRLEYYYQKILSLLTHTDRRLKITSALILSEEEKRRLLPNVARKEAAYPADKTIQEIVEAQAVRAPEAIAFSCQGGHLTYKELNEEANRLAHHIRARCGTTRDKLIGLMLGRSHKLPIGILGILKSGAAYVPIDPDYPEERINYILNDANVDTIILNSPDLVERYSLHDYKVIPLSNSVDEANQYSVQNPTPINQRGDLAYIIYTSGSTGNPKGVMVEHRNVVQLFTGDDFPFTFDASDVWTLFHSVCFDFSVWEMFGAWFFGGKLLMVAKEEAQDPALLVKLLEEEKVTVLNQIPSTFHYVVEQALRTNAALALRYVIFGGDALAPASLKEWYQAYPGTQLINMYGITETTVHVTFKEIGDAEIQAGASNIGQPIPTQRIYIMDENLEVLPVGVAGEMWIGGAGVTRGYINREELTKRRFKVNPYDSSERLYRSGDLGVMLPEGDIIYIGRKDTQVKVRGFRIELGEIERVLQKLDGIDHAVVLAREGDAGEKELIAHLVGQGELRVDKIREQLKRKLPEYMVPGIINVLPKLPKNASGKVDRKALSTLRVSQESESDYAAPQNGLEEAAVKLWEEVLRTEKLGVTHNFFSKGGDSLKAIRLISKMNKQLDLNVKIRDLFQRPTVRGILESPADVGKQTIEEQWKEGKRYSEGFRQDILNGEKAADTLSAAEDIYPLTPIESGMIYSSLLNPEEPIYYDQFTYQLRLGSEHTFKTAFKKLMLRHPNLRTQYFLSTFPEPVKVVLAETVPPISFEEISSLSVEQQKEHVKKFLRDDLALRLSFEGDLLWHMKCFALGEGGYYLIWNFHHAMLDGWSIAIIKSEISDLLADADSLSNVRLSPLKNSYKDYCNIALGRKADTGVEKFWASRLDGYTRNKLPFNNSGRKIRKTAGTSILYKNLGEPLRHDLEKMVATYGVSFQSLCVSAHIYLTHMVCAESDILTGVVSHDRPAIEDGDRIVGCFLHTLPVRVDVSSFNNHIEFVQRVHQELSEVKINEIHLADIAKIVGEKASVSNPLFDCILNFTDFHVLETVKNNEGIALNYQSGLYDENLKGSEMTNTLFDMEVSKTLGAFKCRIKYRTAYFNDADISRALDLYESILRQLAQDTPWDMKMSRLISKPHYQSVVYDFNNTVCPYSEITALHELFEEQVLTTPHKIALKQEGQSCTYEALNKESNQLARLLIERGVEIGDAIGIITQRSFDMVVGMLAILKAGGAYVPVDPEYPVDRQRYILENSSAKQVLVDSNYPVRHLEDTALSCIPIRDSTRGDYDDTNLGLMVPSNNLAYTIYTSGSTGKPKGVMVEHASAVNLVEWVNKEFSVDENDTILFITSMCFDLSVYDIFGLLACGGTIVIARQEDVHSVSRFKNLMLEEGITVWDSVPTTMNYLINELEADDESYSQSKLRLVLMSGDWIPVSLKDRLKEFFPNAKAIGLGGATEGTVWSNYYPISNIEPEWASIPYGKPIGNNFFYILDENQRPVPQGVVGELYIGGIGVARGYANDDEKTAASFVKNPFTPVLGGRMYKTGDVGRLMADGNMEFIGRIDHQTKIRGFRVELGEIENQLVKIPRVKEAVLATKKDSYGDNYLCAYVVADHCTDEIKLHLAEYLPAYMIPSVFVYLDRLPVTSNGKINRRALPEPDVEQSISQSYKAPTTEVEKKLASIWKSILRREKMGTEDNFLDLGAQSLNIAAFANRVQRELQITLSLREVFMHPTIRELSDYVAGKRQNVTPTIEPVQVKERYRVSHAQKRLWLLHQLEKTQAAYNMPGSYFFQGALDIKAFEQALNALVERHEILRTTFEEIDGNPWQKVHTMDHSGFKLVYADLRKQEGNQNKARLMAQEEAQVLFDLEKGPLIRAKLLRLDNEEFVFLFTMHHIISDAWSMQIVIDEVVTLYNAFVSQTTNPLSPLPIQYKDYSAWQNNLLEDTGHQSGKQYWLSQFEGTAPRLRLPYDYPRPESKSFRGQATKFVVDRAKLDRLHSMAQDNASSLFMTLMASVNALMYHFCRQEDVVVGTPTAGRDHQDLENQIGLYLNTLVLRTRFKAKESFEELVGNVRDVTLLAFEHQTYPFDALVRELDLERETGRMPLFDVWVVLQNNGQAAEGEGMKNLRVNRFQNNFQVSRYDLRFNFNEYDHGLSVELNYSTDLFKASTIENMLKTFQRLIDLILETPKLSLEELTFKLEKTKVEDQRGRNSKITRRARNSEITNGQPDVKKYFFAEHKLPLVIEAVNKELDLGYWIKNRQHFIDDQLMKYGGVLFRGFQVNGASDFERIVKGLERKLLNYDFASTPRTSVKGNVYTSTEYPADQEILIHNEMSYTKKFPHRVWFYCEQPAEEAGETPLVDSREIYKNIDKEIRDFFEQRKLLYVRNYHDQLDIPWQKVFQTENKEEVERYCQCNQIDWKWHNDGHLETREYCQAVQEHPITKEKVWFNQAHLFHSSNVEKELKERLLEIFDESQLPRNVFLEDGSPIEDQVFARIKEVYQHHKITFTWLKGDVLLLDNMLAGHGRHPYKGNRSVIVAMTD